MLAEFSSVIEVKRFIELGVRLNFELLSFVLFFENESIGSVVLAYFRLEVNRVGNAIFQFPIQSSVFIWKCGFVLLKGFEFSR